MRVYSAAFGAVLGLLAGAPLAHAQTPAPKSTFSRTPKPNPQTPEPVLVIDARPDAATSAAMATSRAALFADIARSPDITSKADGDADLVAALAGQLRSPADVERDAAAEQVRAAATAYGQLDYAAADQAADRAVVALASLRAKSPGDKAIFGHLQRAYVYKLLSAHNRGDSDAAMSVRTQLERLASAGAGSGRPDGITDLVWNLYAPLDATANAPIHEVEVQSAPGATVWIDHIQVGQVSGGSLKAPVAQGRHLIAVAKGKGHRAIAVEVTNDGQVVKITVPEPPTESQHLPISQLVGDWQRGVSEPDGAAIGALLGRLGAQFALVLNNGPTKNGAPTADIVAVWSLPTTGQIALPLLVEAAAKIDDIGRAVSIQSRGRRRTGPEPGVPLLRETRKDTTGKRDAKKKPKWWVYATIIGAVAAGATLFLANDFVDSRQRIELTW